MNGVKVTETVVGAIHVGQKPRHVCLTKGVCLAARVNTGSAVQQQCSSAADKGWCFVPDTILLVHRRAPQWVPARTPTVHWGPDSGKAVGGPSRSDSRYTANIFLLFLFPYVFPFFSSFLCFFSLSLSLFSAFFSLYSLFPFCFKLSYWAQERWDFAETVRQLA